MRHILLGLGAAVLLSACGDPLRDVPRLADVDASDATAGVAQSPAEARNTGGGLFGRLLNRQPDDPTNAAVEAAFADVAASDVDAEQTLGSDPVEVAEPAATPERRGLFGLFRPRDTADGPESQDTAADVAGDGQASTSTETPAPTPVSAAPVAVQDDAPPRGLAGLFRRNPDRAPIPRNGPDAADVTAGAVLPFGEIARVCGLRANELGTQVDAAAGYRIYDTIPNSTAPRPFYITGFDDNCARTFTGAVVVTGDVETHEFVRYQGSNERISYTETDNAYEALKASVCRVGRGQPCGARTDRLNRNTQFITVYNFFGGTFSAVPTRWAQILVHDGKVLAISIKDS